MVLLRKQTGILLLPLMLCFLALQSFGQSKGSIIKKDGVTSEGFIRFDHRNPWNLQFSRFRQGSSLQYNTAELTGFKLKGGKTYAAKTVQVDGKPLRFFVEVIGDSTFFYLKRDEAFFRFSAPPEQIREEDLLPYLQSLTAPSAKWYDELHLFKLKPNALRYFANNSAAGKSPTVLFTSFGAFTSFNRSILTIQGSWLHAAQTTPAKATSLNISAGAFADLPLWPVNNLSVQAQGSYGKMRFNETLASMDARADYKVDVDFARLSLLPKYSFSLSKLRLFAQAGPSLMYILQSDSQALEAFTDGENVWLQQTPSSLISSKSVLGFEVAAGINYFYLPKHYLALGISQGNSYSEQFHISNQSVTVSLNL